MLRFYRKAVGKRYVSKYGREGYFRGWVLLCAQMETAKTFKTTRGGQGPPLVCYHAKRLAPAARCRCAEIGYIDLGSTVTPRATLATVGHDDLVGGVRRCGSRNREGVARVQCRPISGGNQVGVRHRCVVRLREIGGNGRLDGSCVRLRPGAEGLVPVADEVRDGDRRQDADDGDDDHEFDQGETFLIPVNHFFSSLVG
jgi:hypothetical protein